MEKKKSVDYGQAIREFEAANAGQVLNRDCLQKYVPDDGGVVDYLAVSKEFQRYLVSDESEVIYNGKTRK